MCFNQPQQLGNQPQPQYLTMIPFPELMNYGDVWKQLGNASLTNFLPTQAERQSIDYQKVKTLADTEKQAKEWAAAHGLEGSTVYQNILNKATGDINEYYDGQVTQLAKENKAKQVEFAIKTVEQYNQNALMKWQEQQKVQGWNTELANQYQNAIWQNQQAAQQANQSMIGQIIGTVGSTLLAGATGGVSLPFTMFGNGTNHELTKDQNYTGAMGGNLAQSKSNIPTIGGSKSAFNIQSGKPMSTTQIGASSVISEKAMPASLGAGLQPQTTQQPTGMYGAYGASGAIPTTSTTGGTYQQGTPEGSLMGGSGGGWISDPSVVNFPNKPNSQQIGTGTPTGTTGTIPSGGLNMPTWEEFKAGGMRRQTPDLNNPDLLKFLQALMTKKKPVDVNKTGIM